MAKKHEILENQLKANAKIGKHKVPIDQESKIREFLNASEAYSVDDILADIGEFYNADRSYIFRIDKEKDIAVNTYEWCAPDVVPQIDRLQELSLCEFHIIPDKLAEGEYVVNDIEEELNPNDPIYQLLKSQNTKSLVLNPLIINGELDGFIGVDNPKVNTSMSLLQSVASTVLSAKLKSDQFDQMRDEAYIVLDKLREQFVTLYYVDFTTDYMRTYKTNENYGPKYGVTMHYSVSMGSYVENDIAPNDRERMRHFTNPAYIMKRFRTEDAFEEEFEDTSFGEVRYCSLRYIKANEAGTCAVICGADVTEKKKEQNEAARVQQEQLAIFDALADNYANVYLLNSTAGTLRVLKLSGYITTSLDRQTKKVYSYEQIKDQYISERVYPDDREMMKKAISLTEIRSALAGKSEYTGSYRVLADGEIHHYQFKYMKLNNYKYIIAGFQCIDDVVKAHVAHQKELAESYQKLKEMQDIFAASRMGSWSIYLQDGKEPRMEADDIMLGLLGVAGKTLTQEEVYIAWFSNITPGAVQTVLDCVERLKNGVRDEITYLWKHPTLGERYVRCGGTATTIKGGFVLRGYHYDVDEVVREQKRKDEELAEQNAIINSLSGDYVTIYLANINTETARAIRVADYLDLGNISAITQGEFSIEVAARQWIELNVHPDDKERMLEISALDKVREALKRQDEYVGIYRSNEKAGNHNYQFTIKKMDDVGNVIVGFKLIDAIIESRMEAEKKEKEKEAAHQREIEEQLSIIEALSRSFRNVFVANLKDGTARAIRLGDGYNVRAIRDVENVTFKFDDVVDRWVRETVHPDDKERIKNDINMKNLKKVLSKQKQMVGTYRNIEDGEEHYYQYDFRRVGDSEKVVVGFQIIDSIVKEQTAQKKLLEEHLREEKEHAEVVSSLSTIYSTIFRVDVETHKYEILASVPLMSKVAATIGNFDDVKTKIIENFMEPEFREPLSEFLDLNTLADRLEKVNTVTVGYKAPTGQWMQARFIAKRRNENGRVKEILYVTRDITIEKMHDLEQQEALTNALAAAQQANKSKTTFLNSMSHDIRTPMNAIIGFTALAQTHIDKQEQVQDYLGKISTSSMHLLSLINDILDMSRIESGTVKLDEKAVHIPELLHDLRTMIQSQINSKNLNLFIDTKDVTHENVLTDKLRLNQVLLNIVSNAIKFTRPGGDIIISLAEKPCSLKQYATYEFSVKDNGIGMSKEFIGHIFETFSREYSATVSGIQGTGLGMAITKNIVDMMGGDIRVESEEGKGSVFTVTLNLHLANEPVKNELIPALLGARALIVDDDINTCRSVSKMLRDIEMRPDWTASGKEAILRAQDAAEIGDEYKVYIIDYLMSDMNGIETVRRIRKVISEDVPIIVLTAYDWADFEYEARQAGVTAFVSKPIFMSELRAVLTQPFIKEGIEKEKEKKKIYDYSGKRVLLVEDNELNREIATAILEETGIAIDSVNDGDVAVSTINGAPADKYDLVLMDIQMPKMDGYTATKEIRTLSDNRKANIPIVAMTANAFEEDKRKAFEAGMNGHIIKPISIDEIARVLDEIFEGKK